MSKPDDASRVAILRRRALFISSVTALTGCASQPPSTTDGTSPQPVVTASSAPVVKVQPGPGGQLPAPQGTAGNASGTPATKTKMPPLDTPKGINKAATQRFDWLRQSLEDLHKQIDKVERDLPRDCAITDKACEARWSAIAKTLLQIEERTPSQPVCRGTSDGAKLFEARVAEHQTYVQQRKEDISRALQGIIAPEGEAGKQAWVAHMSAARAAFPTVCLNYSCRDW